MTKLLYTIVFTLFTTVLFAQTNISAFMQAHVFNTPQNKPYLELYLQVQMSSLNYIVVDSFKVATINALLTIEKEDSPIYVDKFNLNTITDTLGSTNISSIHQQRIALPFGSYYLNVLLTDTNDKMNTIELREKIDVNFDSTSLSISDFQFIDNISNDSTMGGFQKNGIYYTPHVGNYFSTADEKLNFYIELYGANKALSDSEKYIINYYIEDADRIKPIEKYRKISRANATLVKPFIGGFPIENLSTGNYNLHLEIINKDNKVIASKTRFFQRQNQQYTTAIEDFEKTEIAGTFVADLPLDSLLQFCEYIYAISSGSEITLKNTLVANNPTKESIGRFFLSFWQQRNLSDPESEWFDYYIRVQEANASFKSLLNEGYQSHRGRVYLQYGRPSQIVGNDRDPSAIPYSIWQYDQIGNQRNRRFIFYNRNLADNEYELLHSDAIGELSEPQWKRVLTATNSGNYDNNELRNDYFGNRLDDQFNE
jgi:GWxTD domain-containing protein